MKRLRILTLIVAFLAFVIYSYKEMSCIPETMDSNQRIPVTWFASEGDVLTPKKDRRKPNQTFLTFPEWFLVFSPEEQSRFFERNTASNFSYSSHVNQFWDSYVIIDSKIGKHFLVNKEYNLMIDVIGYSTQVEYNAKSWYETVIGRATATSNLTEEDRFYQNYMKSYAKLLHTKMWYDYDYKSELKKLWFETSFFGSNMHRKLERKYLLTSEFLVKIIYAEAIKFGSKSMYGETPTTTTIVTDGLTSEMKSDPEIELVSIDKDVYVLRIPRYTAFMEKVKKIALQNINVIEVAGNKSGILITAKTADATRFDKNKTKILFTQKLSDEKSRKRIALVTPIKNLSEFIRFCEQENIEIEHIYDF